MDILLSVVMPVYNQENYVAETIESVLKQSYPAFEFLITDDGSTDGSAAIIKEFAARDSRITAFFESNRGKCRATNELVEKARGKWCVFLDADDVMLPDRLAKQLAFHRENSAIEASSCHCFYIDEKGRQLGVQQYPFLRTMEDFERAASEVVHVAYTGLMVSRKAFLETGGLREQFWPTEDLDFTNRLIEQGFGLLIIQDILMNYRLHASSVSKQKRWVMELKTRYTHHCLAMRRAGKPEPTYEEFLNGIGKDSWLTQLDKRRYRFAQRLQQKASFAHYGKNYGLLLLYSAAAFVFSPNYVLATVRNRLALSGFAKKQQNG